ncbi:disulfide bond formation protein B, partial [Parasutterella excrementihominis]
MSENKNISLDTSRDTFFYFLLCTAAAIVFLFPVGIANMVFGYILGDSPCTLCWGQRIAMIFIALCAFFIVRYGFKPKYIASLFIFTGVGLWQSFRHIAPHSARDLDQGFGLMVLGAHTYFWAEVVFWAVIILLGVMFFFAPKVLGPASENGNNWRTLNWWGKLCF